MKKHYSILIAITVVALAAMSCGIQFVGSEPGPNPQQPIPGPDNPGPQGPGPQNPGSQNPGPQNPGPQNPIPQGPMPQNPGPQNPGPQNPGPQNPEPQNPLPQPGPDGASPAGEILSFTADQMSLKKGACTNLHWETSGGFGLSLNNQPVPPVGDQQVCPPQTTVYGLGLDIGSQMLRREVTIMVSGGQNPNPIATTVTPTTKKSGPKPDITVTPVTPSSPNIPILPVTLVVANLDLALSNIYASSSGKVMVTVKNTGNVPISGSYKIVCNGGIADIGTVAQLPISTQFVTINLAAGKSTDVDTTYTRGSAGIMAVECILTPPTGDTNKSNDKLGLPVN